MLETQLKKLTEAVEANTAAILASNNGSALPTATPETTNEAKPAPAAAVTEPPAPTAAAPAAEPAPTAAAPAGELVVTKKMLGEATIAVARKFNDRNKAIQILSKYGAQKVPELKDESVWPQVLADLQAALES